VLEETRSHPSYEREKMRGKEDILVYLVGGGVRSDISTPAVLVAG
jgi:hypothetical protein